MNILAAFKAAFRMRWGQPRSSWFWQGSTTAGTAYTSTTEVATNAVVSACVLWVARTFPEAPLRVQRRARGGDLVPVDDHPLTRLIAQPNPFYSGILLWQALLADWMLSGNAYLVKVRAEAGNLKELWWLPAWQVEPRWPQDDTTRTFISHYDYRPGGAEATRLDPKDVVHFRYGLDPQNVRKGLSPLASLLREVFTDDEAAAYTATLLRNLAVPGAVVSFETGGPLTQDDADRVKSDYESRFGGNNRGRVLVLSGKTKIDRLSFSPQELDLKALRRIPEERVSAIFGTPAVVVGLGAGLDRSTFANFEEARQAAYESNVIPSQRLFAAEIASQLLPDFGDASRLVVDFDLSQVRVLQPDLDLLWKRLDVGVQGGWITLNEAREQIGLDPLPDADVLYVAVNKVPTDPSELIPPEPQLPAVPPPLEDGTPPPLRALPPPAKSSKAVREVSGAAAYAAALTRRRAQHEPRLTLELAGFLQGQGRRAAASVRGTKAAGDLDWERETAALNAILQRWYRMVLGSVHPLTEDFLGTTFELDDAETRAYLADGATRVVGITATTREAIVAALQAGQAEGESVSALARRVRDATAFSTERATLISRTELAHSSQLSAMHAFRSSGVVVGVRIFDGDGCGLRGHDDPQKANGMVIPLDQMSDIPTLAHPACVRAFSPITEAADLAAVA